MRPRDKLTNPAGDREICAPTGTMASPGRRLVKTYNVFTNDQTLASVAIRAPLNLELCAGVQKLLEMTETPEERFLLSAYLEGT